ncbi:MAG: hydantoinase B/oxoprolinase family protein, partial [Pseudomonadota bacterium]
HLDPPWGVFGGQEGAVGKVEIHNIHTGDTRQAHSKFSGLRTEIGDVVSYFSPSGGGYGDPLERDPNRVLDDVLDGFIDDAHAKEAYGVVLKPADNGFAFALDEGATERLRAERRAG